MKMNLMTWICVVISMALGVYLTSITDDFIDGFVYSLIAGLVIGVLNLGIQISWQRYWRARQKQETNHDPLG